jgi:hypothetical protein
MLTSSTFSFPAKILLTNVHFELLPDYCNPIVGSIQVMATDFAYLAGLCWFSFQ